MRSDHYQRAKKDMLKRLPKISIGLIIISVATFSPPWMPRILCDIFIFTGLAFTGWGLLGSRIAHKQISDYRHSSNSWKLLIDEKK